MNYIRIAVYVIILAFLSFVHYSVVEHEVLKEKNKWERIIQKSKEIQKVKEDEIRGNALEKEREKNAKIEKLNADVAILNKRLSERPSRLSSTNKSPGIREACTGAELYKEDGLFLTGEAARAERIREERDFYYEQYEFARKKLNERDYPQ